MDRCERCGANLALVGRVHNCRARVVELASTPDPVAPKEASISTAGSVRKRGRPRLEEEARDKPWEGLKMSRATWYRRRREEEDGKA